jgi:hypothetical protein
LECGQLQSSSVTEAPAGGCGQWVYVPNPEENPVTFQVGIVGSDGEILLASDRLVVKTAGIRDSSEIDKITIADSGDTAYCWAGDDGCLLAIAQIMKGINAGFRNFRDLLIESAQMALIIESQTREARNGRQLRGGNVLIAHRTPNNLQLWELTISVPCDAERIFDKTTIGDRTNPARLFLEKYFPVRPAKESMLLAAHTVLMAGALNKTFVGGLDIALCSPNGFKKLTRDEIAELENRSRIVDTEIAALVSQ